MDRIEALTKKLPDYISADRAPDPIMKDFVTLSYSTTGNGYYLMKKGVLKL